MVSPLPGSPCGKQLCGAGSINCLQSSWTDIKIKQSLSLNYLSSGVSNPSFCSLSPWVGPSKSLAITASTFCTPLQSLLYLSWSKTNNIGPSTVRSRSGFRDSSYIATMNLSVGFFSSPLPPTTYTFFHYTKPFTCFSNCHCRLYIYLHYAVHDDA